MIKEISRSTKPCFEINKNARCPECNSYLKFSFSVVLENTEETIEQAKRSMYNVYICRSCNKEWF